MIFYRSKPKKNQGFPLFNVQSGQDGNVLIFILIAIILLGALSMTLLRSGQSTSDTADYERLSIQASEILRYASGLELAVKSLRNRGCSENQLSFENAVVSGYSHTGSPSDNSCHVFETAGAGLTYEVPNSNWLDSSESGEDFYGEWYFKHLSCLWDVGTGGSNCWSATSHADIIVFLSWINKDLCMQINRQVGIPNDATEPPTEAGAAIGGGTTVFRGSFALGIHDINSSGEDFTGKKTGCFRGAGAEPAGGYHFFHVLLAR